MMHFTHLNKIDFAEVLNIDIKPVKIHMLYESF